MEPRDSQELVVTRSYHDEEDEEETDESYYYVSGEAVPSNTKLLCMELCSCRSRRRMRLIKSPGAILVLFITCMVNISFNGALGDILGRFCREILHIEEAGILMCFGIIFVRSLPQLGYPVAGWLADVHYGRFKVILGSLWLMLAGYAVILVSFFVKLLYDTEVVKYIVFLAAFPVAFLVINTGLAAFQANVIPFGLDQMPDASTNELSAFIHWYYGLRNILAGIIPLMACYIRDSFELTTVAICVCEIGCVIFALFLCYLFKKKLIIEPKSVNPFKLLHGVLKFAMENKTPVARSAFTFWEADIPSRIDLGKQKYGGPFTNEEVEDIKTFIRTTVVLASVSVFMLGYYTLLLIGILFSQKLVGSDASDHCPMGLLYQIILDTFPIFIMVVIFETVIYPFFKVLIPSMLKRIGIGMVVCIVGLLTLFVLDVYGYNQLLIVEQVNILPITSGSNVSHMAYNCYLVNNSVEDQVNISVHAISSIMLLGALAEAFVFIAALEFIAAQSPYGMRGMLIGAFYCIRGLYGFVTALLFLSFTLGFWQHPLQLPLSSGISCGLPLNATVILISVGGLAVYVGVARRHKHRERDEQFDTRTFAEQYFYGSTSGRVRTNSSQSVTET